METQLHNAKQGSSEEEMESLRAAFAKEQLGLISSTIFFFFSLSLPFSFFLIAELEKMQELLEEERAAAANLRTKLTVLSFSPFVCLCKEWESASPSLPPPVVSTQTPSEDPEIERLRLYLATKEEQMYVTFAMEGRTLMIDSR